MLLNFPEEIHDTAVETLYDVLVQTGLLVEVVPAGEDDTQDPNNQIQGLTVSEEFVGTDPSELQHSAVPSPASSEADIAIKRKKNKKSKARKAARTKAKAKTKANEVEDVFVDALTVDDNVLSEESVAAVVEEEVVTEAAVVEEEVVTEAAVVEEEAEAEAEVVAAEAEAEPRKDARVRPSDVRRQRDSFLAESLGIHLNRLKYNQSVASELKYDVLEFWKALDKYYNVAVYNTSHFTKEKHGRYAVYVDGRLQKICDSQERAKQFTHTRPFPFGTFIVRIGDEWSVKEPVWTEPSRWHRFKTKLGEQLRQLKDGVHRKANQIGLWFLENPLPVISVLFLLLAYFVIVNQTERSGEMTVTYRMVDINDAAASFQDEMSSRKGGTNSRYIGGVKIPGRQGEQMCRYR
jgi:hypothetical protein